MDERKYNYKLTIAYDGSDYSGWQVQPNGVSIQAKLEEAIAIIVRHNVKVVGAGRTDAGVHALGQVAHFHCDTALDLFRFLGSVNGLLPKDIRVKSIDSVPSDFHAQRSAVGKIYHYHICLDAVQSPFNRLYCYKVHEKIDLDILKKGALLFIGTHDFTSFANEAHTGAAHANPVRNLRRLDLVTEEEGIRLEFEGDGFLYKMVRNIVGTLLEAAKGKLSITDIEKIFQAKDRRRAGMAVPPHGLFLVKVFYDF
jgi:tRNA pseudouridine38-40 synthase